jgi:hypothetical protein
MLLTCTVCGDPYAPRGNDCSGMCLPCFQGNFAGAMPPLSWWEEAPPPETVTVTPRQVKAMRRMAERWAQEEDARDL